MGRRRFTCFYIRGDNRLVCIRRAFGVLGILGVVVKGGRKVTGNSGTPQLALAAKQGQRRGRAPRGENDRRGEEGESDAEQVTEQNESVGQAGRKGVSVGF